MPLSNAWQTALHEETPAVLRANAADLSVTSHAKSRQDRLRLDEARVAEISRSLRDVATLPDPLDEVLERRTRPNGLQVTRRRAPLGVVGIIYEARPNVTVDATALCVKSGNALLLKGGSDAQRTNEVLVNILRRALEKTGLPAEALQLLPAAREATHAFLQLNGQLDVVIPRGGRSLIDYVRREARVPVIETGASVVHAYLDAEVDIEQAVALIVNAKCRRVSICNALDVLLVHRDSLPALAERLRSAYHRWGAEVHRGAALPPLLLKADPRAWAAFAPHWPADQLVAADAAHGITIANSWIISWRCAWWMIFPPR